MQIYEKQFKPGLKQKYLNKRECLDPQQTGPRGRAQVNLHTARKDGMSDEMAKKVEMMKRERAKKLELEKNDSKPQISKKIKEERAPITTEATGPVQDNKLDEVNELEVNQEAEVDQVIEVDENVEVEAQKPQTARTVNRSAAVDDTP